MTLPSIKLVLTAGLTPLTPGYSKVRGTEGGEPGRVGGWRDTPQEKACSSTEASPPLSGPWKDPNLWRPGPGRPPQHGRARTRPWVTPRSGPEGGTGGYGAGPLRPYLITEMSSPEGSLLLLMVLR